MAVTGDCFLDRMIFNNAHLIINSARIMATLDSDGTRGYSVYCDNSASRFPCVWYIPNGSGGTTLAGSIRVTDGATFYQSASDRRLKENIVTMEGCSERIQALRPVTYSFKAVPECTHQGFIADEVQAVLPCAVSGEPDAVTETGEIDPQQIDHAKIIPCLVGSIKELLARVEALEAALQ